MCCFGMVSKGRSTFKRPLITRNPILETVGEVEYNQSLEEIAYYKLNKQLIALPCRLLTQAEIKELNEKLDFKNKNKDWWTQGSY